MTNTVTKLSAQVVHTDHESPDFGSPNLGSFGWTVRASSLGVTDGAPRIPLRIHTGLLCSRRDFDAGSASAAHNAPDETALQRQERRYELCRRLAIETWQRMPETDFEPLPRGIKRLAEIENISTSAFSKDVKKHIKTQSENKEKIGALKVHASLLGAELK